VSLLRVTGLGKRLAGRRVLEQLELQLGAGETVIVIGANGSGKSTLLRILCGILSADHGRIELLGHVLSNAPRQFKSLLGYVPDGLEVLPDLRVSEWLQLVRALRSLPRAPSREDASWQERLGVTALSAERLRALSFGQRKRVALAAALAGSPPLLLIDEPSNGLDRAGSELLVELLSWRTGQGKSQLVTSNDSEFVRAAAGRCLRLEAGRLTATPSEE
jgi:ABC-2 type transport system ATP-binding protein